MGQDNITTGTSLLKFPMLRFLVFLLCLVGLHFPAFATVGGVTDQSVPIDRSDFSSLQRGAVIFANYCMGCHSMRYMRYGQVAKDLSIPESIVQERLIYTEAGLGDEMKSSMRPDDAKEWFNQALPPDLSLSAKLRGVDWLYAYLRSFYRDKSRPSGWDNTVFPGVSMPHVLSDLQGEMAIDENGHLAVAKPGKLSRGEYNQFVTDLVNFLDYVSDPLRPERYFIGYWIISILLLLLVVAYFLYREYWQDIH